MRIDCPECHIPYDCHETPPPAEFLCPQCSSSFQLARSPTAGPVPPRAAGTRPEPPRTGPYEPGFASRPAPPR